MLKDFMTFTHNLFPSIHPYTQTQTKKALDQFKEKHQYNSFLNQNPYDFLAQGDIFDNIPFIKQDIKGNLVGARSKGILLSNTCSADRDDFIVIAPMLKISETGLNIENVSDNKNCRLMYIPDKRYKDYVIDFALLNTYSRDCLNEMLKSEEIEKESSLNQFGYYFLLCKLTINFMRPEDMGVQEDRSLNYYSEYIV